MAEKASKGRRRHVPTRTCVACRQSDAKRELVRIVRAADGGVQVDPTGKKAGRGAYLCCRRSCWDQALKRGALEAALKTKVAEADVAALRSFAVTLPAEIEEDSGGAGVTARRD